MFTVSHQQHPGFRRGVNSALPFLLLLFCIPTTAQSALSDSTIVVFRSDQKIVIGIASRTPPNKKKGTLKHGDCKIIQAGNLVFAAAGLTGDPSAPGFDVQLLARQAAQQGGSTAEIVHRFESAVSKSMAPYVSGLRGQPTYEKMVNSLDRSFLQVVFAAIEKETPVVYWLQFVATHTDPQPFAYSTIKKSCPGCDQDFVLVMLGKRNTIIRLAQQTRFDFSDVGRLIHYLLRQEAEGLEGDRPVEILQITAKQTRWIRNELKCPDRKPSRPK